MKRIMVRAALAAGVMLTAVAAVSAGQTPTFAAFSKVERGLWALKATGGATRSVCVADPEMLLQPRAKAGQPCSRFVVDNGASSATVTYSCPGAGEGRTTISVETPRLMRIESQGVDGGMPFASEVEARRIGAC